MPHARVTRQGSQNTAGALFFAGEFIAPWSLKKKAESCILWFPSCLQKAC